MALSIAETTEYLQKGTQLKEEQNAIAKALAKYTKIFLWVNGLNPPEHLTAGLGEGSRPAIPAPLAQEIVDLRLAANLNCCTCYLKLGDWDRAMRFCEKALEVQPENKKAIYRRGQIYMGKKDVENAHRDFATACAAFPNDAAVRADLKRAEAMLKEMLKEHEARERKQFAGMFERMSI